MDGGLLNLSETHVTGFLNRHRDDAAALLLVGGSSVISGCTISDNNNRRLGAAGIAASNHWGVIRSSTIVRNVAGDSFRVIRSTLSGLERGEDLSMHQFRDERQVISVLESTMTNRILRKQNKSDGGDTRDGIDDGEDVTKIFTGDGGLVIDHSVFELYDTEISDNTGGIGGGKHSHKYEWCCCGVLELEMWSALLVVSVRAALSCILSIVFVYFSKN